MKGNDSSFVHLKVDYDDDDDDLVTFCLVLTLPRAVLTAVSVLCRIYKYRSGTKRRNGGLRSSSYQCIIRINMK